jgi:hypothetical protein
MSNGKECFNWPAADIKGDSRKKNREKPGTDGTFTDFVAEKLGQSRLSPHFASVPTF